MYPDAELLSAYMDNEVSDAERASIEARLERDENLREELHRYTRIQSALHELAEPDPEPSRQSCWQAIQHSVRRRPGFWRRRISLPVPVAAAAAAVMLISLGTAAVFSGLIGGLPAGASPALSGLSSESQSSMYDDDLTLAARADMNIESRIASTSFEELFRELRLNEVDDPVMISLPAGHRFELNGDPIAMRARDVSWSAGR